MGGRGGGSRGRGGGGGGGGDDSTMTSGGVGFQLDSVAQQDNMRLVEVDVAKLDAAWKKDTGYHLPPDGSNDIGNRRERFKEFLETGKPVNAPRVFLDEGRVSFEDGRHRTAVLRDMGKSKIVVAVDKSQVQQVKRTLQ